MMGAGENHTDYPAVRGGNCVNERFFGWRVLAGCVLCMFLLQGTIQAFAVFLPAIVADTGWRLSMVAQVSTFCSGSAFLANLALKKKPYSGVCAASAPQAACGAGENKFCAAERSLP